MQQEVLQALPAEAIKADFKNLWEKSKLLRMYFWALAEGLIQTYFTEISQPISNLREIYLVFKLYNISLYIKSPINQQRLCFS